MGVLVRTAFQLLPCLALVAGIACAKPKIELPNPGRLGHSRIVDLLAAPARLAQQPSDSQQTWMELADSAVVLAARSEGNLDAHCSITMSQIDTAENRVLVKVDYNEGPQYHFGKIDFLGPDGSQSPPIPPNLPVRSGDPFSPSRNSVLLQASQSYYRHRGWLDATVEPDLELRRDSSRVDVNLTVNLGRVAIFERLELSFKGEHHLTNPKILEDLWPVKPGDTIRNEDLAKYNRMISQTRLFNMARLTRGPGRNDSAKTTVSIELAEKIPGSLDFGLSWEQPFGWGIDGTIRHRNFRGTLNELSLAVIMAQYRQQARIGLGKPLLWGTPVSLDMGLTLGKQDTGLADTTSYRELSLAPEFTFSFLPSDWSSVSLGLGAQRVTKYPHGNASPKVQYSFETDLGGGLDFRNDPIDPIRGWSMRSNLGWGGQFTSDTSYIWLQSIARVYQPLFWRFKTAFALEGGRFLNTTTMDGAKVFYLGGSRTVRSYGYGTLKASPDSITQNGVATLEPLRPRYLRGSGELRFDLPLSLQAVGFLDWARIWNEGQAPDLTNLDIAKIGYGTGLRFRMTLLSIRLDYSFGRGDEKFAFDFAQAI